MNFGQKLRNLRIERGLSQMELAKGLKTSQAAITSWENGRREPNFDTVQRIASYFRVPLSSLIPSENELDSDSIATVAEAIHLNPKLRILFDRSKFLSDSDLDAVLGIISAISKERNDD